MKKIDEKLENIYLFIESFIEENGFPPTVREIGSHFSIKSTATVYYYLEKLRETGRITQMDNKNRAIGISRKQQAETNIIPLVGNVSAGRGILAVENIEDRFPIPKDLFCGDDLFMLRIDGDSMINAGISSGDYVVVKQQASADIGDIAVVYWQEKATVKRILALRPELILHPENESMEDITLSAADCPQILGKVVGCIKKF